MGSRLFAALLAELLVALLTFTAHPVRAADWYVTTGGTGALTGANWDNALPTITAGLQKAGSGDTVRVWSGIYNERITLKAGVTLSGGFFFTGQIPFLSILDGGNGGTVVTVPPGATATTVLEGFTIRNGSGTVKDGKTYGGGIYCANASPVLRWNHVTGCQADLGGGVHLANASPEVTLSHFTENLAKTGGAINCSGGAPIVSICTFRRNVAEDSGGAVFIVGAPDLVIGCSVFEANRAASGSAVAMNTGWCLSNTLIRNAGTAKGALAVNAGALVAVANTIISDNSSGVWLAPLAASLFYNNDVFGNVAFNYTGVADPTGTNGNISKAPALADPAVGDYTPCFGSPCVDRGNDLVVPPGAVDYYARARISGVSVDIGAAELVQPTPLQPIYVNGQTGNDANNGLSWATAKKTIYGGGAAASAAGREVWVAKGGYGWNAFYDKDVRLYGGFAGTETKRNERDPEANKTTLLAWGEDRPVLRFINGPGAPRQVIVDGFTIRDGLHSGSSATYEAAGIICENASVIISGNQIVDNKGTGIYIEGTDISPIVSCNTIYRNGPIDNTHDAGGVIVRTSTGRILHNTIEFNGADFGKGGVNVRLGSSLPPSGTFDICNNVIENNQGLMGGGISIAGGTAQVYPVIRGNIIRDNRATTMHPSEGGGIRAVDYYEIVDNLITSNNADIGGGIAVGVRNNAETKDSLIANNFLVGNTYGSWYSGEYQGGGGIGLIAGHVLIANNTLVNNTYDAIASVKHPYAGGGPITIQNNIFTGSGCALSSVVGSYNAFFGNQKNFDYGGPGPDDVLLDPRFVNPASGNYHLRSDSPCIDKGLDTAVPFGALDCDGEPRILGAHVDIGADEFIAGQGSVLPDVSSALRVAGGMEAASAASMAAMNVDDTGTSQGKVDLHDVVHLLRQLTGLE